MSFYTICMTFIIYSFLGWCAEVVYAAADRGTYVNPGFLTGPVCPIYGVGMVLIKLLLDPMKENLFLLFFGSMLLASLLEFIAGFLMDKISRCKWWDRSDKPLNLGGYVSLKTSLLWGVGAVAVILGADPAIQSVVKTLSGWFMVVIMVIVLLLIGADLVLSIMRTRKFLKRVSELEDMYENVKRIADKLGSGSAAVDAEREILEQKYRRLASEFTLRCRNLALRFSRIVKAFPTMTSKYYPNAVERVKAAVGKLSEENKAEYGD